MIRVGIAGLGTMGGMHAHSYKRLPNAKLVAGADLEPERRDQFAKEHQAQLYPDFETMLAEAELDMVDICLPTYLHAEAVQAAAAAKKHVLCEKPAALSVADCDAMAAAAEQNGVQFMVAQVLRFYPSHATIKEIVDSARLGKVDWVSATRMGARPLWSWQDWFNDPKRSGGAALDLHCHDVDFIGWLLGRPTTVSAAGVKSDRGSMDSIFTTMSGFPGGAKAFAESSWTTGADFPFITALKLNLEGGTISLGHGGPSPVRVDLVGGGSEYPELVVPQASETVKTEGNISELGGYFLECQYFVDCLEHGLRPDRVPPVQSKQAVEICLAAIRSAETGAPVEL
jgi:predicted dehydrogenase